MTRWTPGDRAPDTAAMLRVDQAGEYGATRIYAGQMAVLGRGSPASHVVARMAAQEERHLKRFNALMAERRVRPTLLQPLWDVAGFALGATTALMSEQAAMACTEAVETEIDRHYAEQLAELGDSDPAFSADIAWRRRRRWLPITDRRDPPWLPRRDRPVQTHLTQPHRRPGR